jgi:hypothetical protein
VVQRGLDHEDPKNILEPLKVVFFSGSDCSAATAGGKPPKKKKNGLTLWLCLVPGMQNANYFGMIKCKMPKFSWVCLVSFKMPNFL